MRRFIKYLLPALLLALCLSLVRSEKNESDA